MSISDKNKKAILEHFSIDEKPIKPLKPIKHKESFPSKQSDIQPNPGKQLPTNLANRRLGEEFFGNFGKPEEHPEYYYRDDETPDNSKDAFLNNDGEVVYDPYVVMRN